jgi:hypothetical protein
VIGRPEFIAQHAVTRAIDDEIAHRGAAQISETLAVFLEHRFAEAFRGLLPEADRERRFDA